MSTRLKCLAIMLVLSLIGFGPLSLTCLIGLYVVVARPEWFLLTTRCLYGHPSTKPITSDASNANFETRLKVFLSLMLLLIIDIAPVPVTGSIGLYVVLARPVWFLSLVERVYAPRSPR